MLELPQIKLETSESIIAALQLNGAFYLSAHELSDTILTQALTEQTRLFGLPNEHKCKFICPDGGGQKGWIPFGVEKAESWLPADPKECWHIKRPDSNNQNLWPSHNTAFQITFENLYQKLDKLAVKIMYQLSHELGFYDPTFMHNHNSVLRLVQYRNDGTPWLAREHIDVNLFTIRIYESSDGCEYFLNEKWQSPLHNQYLMVTAGQMLNHITNDRIKALPHRVKAKGNLGQARQFAGYFVNPAVDAWLPCIPSNNELPKYSKILNIEMLAERARQINHS